MDRRGELESLLDLLIAIEKHPGFSKNRIYICSRLNPQKCNRFLDNLNDKGFTEIQIVGRPHRLRLTEKGRIWLSRMKNLLREVSFKEN